MAKKRQTFAKMSRDRELKEKREAKAAKKEEKKRLKAEALGLDSETGAPDEAADTGEDARPPVDDGER